MKINVSENGNIELTEVYNPIDINTEKERFTIWMRDSGFEFNYNGKLYSAQNGVIKPQKSSNYSLGKLWY